VIDPAKLDDSDDGKVVTWDWVRSATEASEIQNFKLCWVPIIVGPTSDLAMLWLLGLTWVLYLSGVDVIAYT